MPNSKIAAVLFQMRKTGQELISISGELYSADELLSQLQGRRITEDVGHEFILHGAIAA